MMNKASATQPRPTNSGLRSRRGCWTCKARHKKCDEKRPVCGPCSEKLLRCGGYELRLKWTHESAASQAGTKTNSLQLCPTVTVPSLFQSQLEWQMMNDFAEWGCLTLGSRLDHGVLSQILPQCAESKSLLINCITYQLMLLAKFQDKHDEYYSKSITCFRRDVCNPIHMGEDATLLAGFLLCWSTMNTHPVWTIHLNGLLSLFQHIQHIPSPRFNFRLFGYNFLDVLGVMDLPVFTVGRQTPSACIWYNYCRHQTAIEPFSCLPYSLLDLLSAIQDLDIEDRLWTWSYPDSDPAQKSVWEATRLASILSARQHKLPLNSRTADTTPLSLSVRGGSSRSTANIVRQLLRILEQVPKGCEEEEDSCWWNMGLYVLFMTASEPENLTDADKTFINQTWMDFFEEENNRILPYFEPPLNLIHELWSKGNGTTVRQLAYSKRMELCLL